MIGQPGRGTMITGQSVRRTNMIGQSFRGTLVTGNRSGSKKEKYDWPIFFFFFFILRRMGKNKALAHHTSAYFHTRRVSI